MVKKDAREGMQQALGVGGGVWELSAEELPDSNLPFLSFSGHCL